MWHHAGIDATSDPELARLREEIDRLDRRLIALLTDRARVVQRVTEHKRRSRLPVVDRHREDAMLERIADLATQEGLDPRVAQRVLRTIVDAFTLLQVEELGVADGTAVPADRDAATAGDGPGAGSGGASQSPSAPAP